MTKSGLSTVWQKRILQALDVSKELTTRAIGKRVGYPWYPKCSAVRVTMFWLVRQGCVERLRPGLYQKKEEST